MRLTRITLRNFRGVADSTVEFSEGVTVIEGPNEVGKSSIAEAIRLIRNAKSSSKNREVMSVKPVHQDAGPEVVLELRTGAFALIYRKRWLKNPITELSISAPVPENLTGDAAHDRFLRVLEDTLDVDLLEALDVVQGKSLDQPRLVDITALRRALGDSTGGAQGHDALTARIDAEYSRYFTSTGRSTSDYKKLETEVPNLEAGLEDQARRSAEADAFTEDHARLSGALEELTGQLANAKSGLQELEEDAGRLEQFREAGAKAQQEFERAEGALKSAAAATAARADLVSGLEGRAKTLGTWTGRIEANEGVVAAAEAGFGEAKDAVAAREESLQTARAAARAAAAAIQARRDRADQAALIVRLEQAREAERLRAGAAAILAEAEADDAAVNALASLETELRLAEARRTAASARVRVRRLSSTAVTLDGTTLPEGEDAEASVSDVVTVVADGVLTVEVHPGTPPADLDKDVEVASSALSAALSAAGVESVEVARAVAARRRDAESKRDSAQASLRGIVGDSSIDALEELRAEVEARIEISRALSGDDADMEALESALTDATQAAELADGDLIAAREMLERSRTAHTAAREDSLRADVELKRAQEEHDNAASSLALARESQSDDQVGEKQAEAKRALATAEANLAAAVASLEAAGSDALEMHLKNARQLVERKQQDRDATRKRVDELETLISDRMTRGIYDDKANAEVALLAARDSLERIQRAALAAQLLKSTIDRHRDEAQQKYVAPFKERIERLGKVVFGSDLSVHVSQELEIESRTLDGRTVPFDSLSAGTREQLSLLGRLACAQLVDADEGTPVILDDTLGFADPKRLLSLSVVLNDVGESAQVILLTCQPSRFASLGGAQVVRLPVN